MAEEEEYAAFVERVERTICVENLAPAVTSASLKGAFGQFGTVKSIIFIPNYFVAKNSPQAALVEMDNSKLAGDVIDQTNSLPFMIGGIPRPVRVLPATYEMFGDRPRIPKRKIVCCWLDRQDPEYAVAKKVRDLVVKHIAEASFVLEHHRAEEEKLAAEQREKLKLHYQKLEMLDSLVGDPFFKDLKLHYGMKSSNASSGY